jgi:hypothetical protein
MPTSSIIRFLNPRKFRRDRDAAEIASLKDRDGDKCARCRRVLRFDLPAGHDLGAVIERSTSSARLCHRRCNPSGVDHTGEVTERVRRKNEAALFTKSRKRRAA